MRYKICVILTFIFILLFVVGCKNDVGNAEQKMYTDNNVELTVSDEYLETETESVEKQEDVYLLKETTIQTTWGGSWKITIKYDEQNRKIEERTESSTGEVSGISKYVYFDNECRESVFDENGCCVGKTIYYYNLSGEVIESTKYDAEDRVVRHEIYVYDESGKILSEIVYNVLKEDEYIDEDGSKLASSSNVYTGNAITTTYIYDEENRLIEARKVELSTNWQWASSNFTINQNVDESRTVIEYINDKQSLVIQYDTNGEEYVRTVRTYDSEGNLIELETDMVDEAAPDTVRKYTYIKVGK